MPSAPDPIRAQAIGYLVYPWQARLGSVHSAFDGAVNLGLGGRLCTLAPAGLPDGPATIRVAEADWAGLAGAAAGDPVALRAAWLRVGPRVIDLRSAAVWRPAEASNVIAPGALDRAAELRVRAIQRGGAEWIPDLIRAALTGREGEPAVAGLIGRGAGLTPSGDDALVGALAACWATRRADPGSAALHTSLALRVRERLDGTNDLSAWFLALAAAGHFQAPVWEAAVAIVDGVAEPGGQRRLLAMGATSGADCALGLSAVLETIIDRSDRAAA